MYVRTLSGQLVTISTQIDALHQMSAWGSFATTPALAEQKRLGRQIIAACGTDTLKAVLNELPLYLTADHLKVLTPLWNKLINPEVDATRQKPIVSKDSDPVDKEAIAFDLEWGAGSFSRCYQALASVRAGSKVKVSRVTAAHLQAQGIRALMADAFLAVGR